MLCYITHVFFFNKFDYLSHRKYKQSSDYFHFIYTVTEFHKSAVGGQIWHMPDLR